MQACGCSVATFQGPQNRPSCGSSKPSRREYTANSTRNETAPVVPLLLRVIRYISGVLRSDPLCTKAKGAPAAVVLMPLGLGPGPWLSDRGRTKPPKQTRASCTLFRLKQTGPLVQKSLVACGLLPQGKCSLHWKCHPEGQHSARRSILTAVLRNSNCNSGVFVHSFPL